jgi:DNA-binding MarR family transcriptional regulator
MPRVGGNGRQQPTLLEATLRLQGDFRKELEPIGVTPLQGAVIMFLRRRVDSQVKDASAALSVQQPTMSVVVRDLVRKGWVTNAPSKHDKRAVNLRLSRQGEAMARSVEKQVGQMTFHDGTKGGPV